MAVLLRTMIAVCCALLAAVGCRLLDAPPEGKSPLRPFELANDAVALEVVTARFPLGEPALNDELWSDIDEQQIPANLRRELSQNGFRAGVLVGQPPTALRELLARSTAPLVPGTGARDLSVQSPVRRNGLHVRNGRRAEIIASGMYDRWPVLTRNDGQVAGRTRFQAQGVLAMHAYPQGDGRARLAIVPELHHGDVQQAWSGEDGVMRAQFGKQRDVFDQLAIEVLLTPGQTLVLSSLPERPGSLGHYFFTEQTAGRIEQKLLLVRLGGSKYDDLFAREMQSAETSP